MIPERAPDHVFVALDALRASHVLLVAGCFTRDALAAQMAPGWKAHEVDAAVRTLCQGGDPYLRERTVEHADAPVYFAGTGHPIHRQLRYRGDD